MTLVKTCRRLFAQFGVPEEIAHDGGSSYKSYEWMKFLEQWGIDQRKSSANYPQSNGRAELAVKSCKRLLTDNVDEFGNLDGARVTRALLIYRNTPVAGIGMSPAFMMYGRQLRDPLPTAPSYRERYGERSKVWTDISRGRELAAARKHAKVVERYDKDKRPLAPLSVGDCVSIQNRAGTHPLRWDRTGKVVERLEHRQYLVKADGSGLVLLRTRAHLRKIDPVTSDRSAYDVDKPVPVQENQSEGPPLEPLLIPGRLQDGVEVIHPVKQEPDLVDAESVHSTEQGASLDNESPPVVEESVRRSGRSRRAPNKLSPKLRGKYH